MDRKVRVRFAPSPTGPLHIGGVRTALYNYLFAKKHGGDCILRIEDTDQTRFVEGAEKYIVEAFKWLGIKYDEGVHVGGPFAPYRQSERKASYRQYAEQLVKADHAYYAFDTTEELDAMRERQKASNMPAQYDAVSRQYMKNSLTLSEDEVKSRIEDDEPYVIRIKLPRKEDVRFHDEIRGWVTVNTSQMDDKVLFKSDGMPTYHMANVVDDYLMKITHVIRGEEWLPSAPLHVLLYRYLGWEEVMPKFAHLPLLLKPEGNGKLSKRDGDRLGFPVFPLEWTDPKTNETSSGYREAGYFPEAVVNMLALLGWHPAGSDQEIFSMEELIEQFTLEKVSKSGAKFDQTKAIWINQHYLRAKTDKELAEAIQPFLDKCEITAPANYVEKVCGMMKEKINFTHEIYTEGSYFFVSPHSYDEQVVRKKWTADVVDVLKKLRDNLEALEDFTTDNIHDTFNATAEANGVSAGKIMQPFRLALSGVAGGPPIFEMVELLGKSKVVRRMDAAFKDIKVPSGV